MARSRARCSSCGKSIDRITAAKLVVETKQEQRMALLSQKRDFDKRILALVAKQKKAFARLAALNVHETNRIRRNADERAKRERTLFDQEFARLKRNYQLSLTQLKESYAKQNQQNFDELKMLIANSADESKKNLDVVVESSQAHIQVIHGWLQQELPRLLLENAQCETYSDDISGTGSETEVDRLVNEISSRDELIQKTEGRIKELEGMLASRQGRPLWKRMRRAAPSEPYKEEEIRDPQQEILSVIREIAQEREQLEKAREQNEQGSMLQFADSFGSRLSKNSAY